MDERIDSHLLRYKEIIDFGDLTERQNYKWISNYVGKHYKIVPVNEMLEFLLDAIHLQIKYKLRGTWIHQHSR